MRRKRENVGYGNEKEGELCGKNVKLMPHFAKKIVKF